MIGSKRAAPRRWGLLLGAGLLLLCGCLGREELQVTYGPHTGSEGRKSINGFGSLRESFEANGWRSRSISRLGDRMLRLEAIVWIPTETVAISNRETAWFEDWLQQGDRTLVYVVYDGGSEADYWRNARPLALAKQRLEYFRRRARATRDRRSWLRIDQPLSNNGWFLAERLEAAEPVRGGYGAWALQRGGDAPRGMPAVVADAPVRNLVRVSAFDPDVSIAAGPGITVGPNFQIGLEEETSLTETEVSLDAKLRNGRETPLVTELTAEAWGNSRVLVVSASGLLNNYATTTPIGRQVIRRVIATAGAPRQVGFLNSSRAGVRISDSTTDMNRRTGMELLTTWPLSLITVHLTILGVVACLILMPIFGRPRDPQPPSQSDFADHLTAIATLMSRKPHADEYARQRISEYMRRVRGETQGPWVQPVTEGTLPKQDSDARRHPANLPTNGPEATPTSTASPEHEQPGASS